MNRLQNKVAIVTGAASGQGYATALALVAEGARVMAADLDEAGLASLSAAVGAPDRIATMRCDVSSEKDVQALVARTEEVFGGLNAMLNCAGYLCAAPFTETGEEMLDKIIAVNIKGVVYGCKHAIPALQRSGGGSIINWGSVNSFVAEPEISIYTATKGAVLMLSKSIAVEYAKDNIRANCICPGAVKTPMVAGFFTEEFFADEAAQRAYQPLGIALPQDVANVAVFLASDESRMMTGSALMVDGGYTAH